MNKAFYIFLIVPATFFFCSSVSAQLAIVETASHPDLHKVAIASMIAPVRFFAVPSSPVFTGLPGHPVMYAEKTLTVSQDMAVKNLSFFCRQEWKVERSLKMPLRLRVGTLDQCNTLEGK